MDPITLPDGRSFTPVFLDFETLYDSKAGYTLKKMHLTEYIRDKRFKVWGVGVAVGDGAPKWHKSPPEMDWSRVAIIGHNIKFDGLIATEKYGIKPGLWVDTLGMSRAVLGGFVPRHSLAALATHFGFEDKGIMLTDGKHGLTTSDEAALAEYCLGDVTLTRKVFLELVKRGWPASQYAPLDWTVRAFVNPTLRLDAVRLAEAEKEEAARRAGIFAAIGIDKKVFSSNDKFHALLLERGYEVPMKKSPKEGKDPIPALSLSDPEFLDIANSEDDELAALCEARIAAKSALLETRAGKMARVALTGPWPVDVGFSGAQQTHRFSGGPGSGGNFQNLPVRKKSGQVLRDCVLPPEGHSLVVGDFSAIEARIVAFLADEPSLKAIYKVNGDPYVAFGSRFYGRPITKADKPERSFAKEIVLGSGYRMGAKKMQKRIKVVLGEDVGYGKAKSAIDLYREQYPRIAAFWSYLDGVLDIMADGGSGKIQTKGLQGLQFANCELSLPSGLKLRYPGLHRVPNPKNPKHHSWAYTAFRNGRQTQSDFYTHGGSLLENICQALAGEICKLAIARIEGLGWQVVGQVHDEILVVAGHGDEAACARDMEEAMSASPSWWPEIALNAEVAWGPTWLKAK